jgi:hypothetical protein
MNGFTSWKTSLLGLGAGIMQLLSQGTNWKSVIAAAGVTLLGWFAKDNNVTGGTVPNDK